MGTKTEKAASSAEGRPRPLQRRAVESHAVGRSPLGPGREPCPGTLGSNRTNPPHETCGMIRRCSFCISPGWKAGWGGDTLGETIRSSPPPAQ